MVETIPDVIVVTLTALSVANGSWVEEGGGTQDEGES